MLIVVFVFPFLDRSHRNVAEEEKNSKRKVGTHIPLTKIYLKRAAGREHTHTHTHAKKKKQLKKLKKKKTKRRRKNGERKIRGR